MNRDLRNILGAVPAGRVLARMLAVLAIAHAGAVVAQTITTIAGRGVQDGGPASSAPLSYPQGVAFDAAGNLYIADHFHHRIRKVAAGTGIISTLAGDGTNLHSGDGGPAASAGVGYPQGIAIDASGNVYFSALNRVRKIDAASGNITTIAGTATAGFAGDGGPAASANLSDPRGLAFDAAGNLYIADGGNHRIRKLAAGTGIITTIAGNGTPGFSGDGGAATAASLRSPSGIAFDPLGFLVFADSGNDRARRVDLVGGGIVTVAGGGAAMTDGGPATGAQIANPQGIAFDSAGKVFYVSDGNSRIRKVSLQTGAISTAAGSGVSGYSGDGGSATSATINYLAPGMALDASGNLHFSDALNHRVRKVASGTISTVAGTGVANGIAATNADLYLPRGMAFDSGGNLYFADNFGRRIRKLTNATGVLATVAGQDGFGPTVEGGVATSATVWYPFGVAVDAAGNAYYTEYYKFQSSRVRSVAPGGNVTTLAGGSTEGFGGDGGPPASALLRNPRGVAVDVQGNVYIADTENNRIRKVTKSTGLITTVAGNGTAAFAGDGGPATSASLNLPGGIAVDGAGNLYIADTGNNRVRKVAFGSGSITTIGGDGTCCYGGDYGPATAARLYPGAIAADSVGNVFIADFTSRVRRIDATTGLITTVAGNGTQGYSGDGGAATSAMLNAPAGVAVDTSGNLYIADNYNGRIRKVSPDTTPPDTTIATKPAAATTSSSATFTFTGSDPGGGTTGFQCSLDGAAFVACSATTRFQNLALGAHTLQVRAVDAWGNIDVSPVIYDWTVNIAPAVATTQSHTLALDASGNVYAWGSDSHGQLGQGRTVNRATPTRVSGLPTSTHIALFAHALAVDANRQVWSWGDNSCGGQLGPRGGAVTSKPARVIGATNMKKVAAGRCFSLALRTDGTVWGWGFAPGYGADITTGTVTTMRQITGFAGITEIVAGYSHALALRSDGTLWAFGDNSAGQLGLGAAGAIRTAVQVPGLAGVTAIAAGRDVSVALLGNGQIYFWGKRGDGTVFPSPVALPSLGGTPVAISISADGLYAVRSDGVLLLFNSTTATWQTVAGYASLARIDSSGQGYNIGITASGQLVAGGGNTFGQLGQGDTAPRTGVVSVPGFSETTMAASGAVNPSVLALKADGSVWFWGADTLGESGDGSATFSSVPRAVSIPATVRAIATGNRFSVALDTDGNVWGWGDNSQFPFDGTAVNRSTPTLISGVSGVQAIAAGGNGVILYLLADGTVKLSGTLAPLSAFTSPTVVPGLVSTVAIAVGTAAYAVSSDGTLKAFGANESGELGNGTTVSSATPVSVQGISGSVVSISAGNGRASAVTNDGAVWSWGSGVLGNGSAGASLVPVKASGVTDAAEVSVGKVATLVRRKDGGILAWGNTGLADATGKDILLPYAITLEPVQSVRAGPGNAIGFLVGSTGLIWGFGYSGLASSTTAQIGNGSYVSSGRPALVLAVDAAGSVDAANWYLDLDTANVDSIPANLQPRAVGVTRLYGSDSGLSLDATMKYKSADFGKRVNNYVFARVPPAFFKQVPTAPGTWTVAKMQAKAGSDAVLAQLTPSGWTNVTGQLTAYSQSTANAAGSAMNILSGVNAALIPGARFCIGYGESSGSMLTAESLSEVLVLEGASSSVSGVPCVLSGLYLEGPSSSTSGATVAFNASVVGLSPTGTVQFQDGSSSLLSPVSLSASSSAVGRASLSTATLTVGVHSIGASYSGDATNAAASAAVPVRHEVVRATPGQTQTSLTGPSSSDVGSEVAFTATVAGNQVTGLVQFQDGGANLGDAVPLVGGTATLRVSTLAQGSHSITAAYSGDGGNAASTSSAIAHTVYAAFTTSVALASSVTTTTSGDPVTLTATVTGSNPTGTVTFRDGATTIGTATLVGGTASITVTSLEAGEHVITAVYSGDANNQGVTSGSVFQQVGVATPTVTIFQASPQQLAFGGQSMNTTAPAQTVTLTNAGAAAVTVTSVTASTYFAVSHNCASVAAGGTCSATVTFTPAAQGALTGTLSIVTSGGTQTIALSGTGEKSLTTHYYRSILRRAADAGGKAFWEAEATRVQALGVNVNEVWFAMAQSFFGSAEYLAFNRDNAGFVTDLYTTFFNRAPDAAGLAYWQGQLDQGLPREVALAGFMFSSEFAGFTQAIFGTTVTRKELDTVVDFFRGLLGRLPDDGGFNFWLAQFRTAQCAGGAAVNAQVESISSQFALGAEYAARARSASQYVGDLYNAFLRRGGDLAGVQFWISQVSTAAQTREQVRQAFVASPEFQARVAAIIAQGCLP